MVDKYNIDDLKTVSEKVAGLYHKLAPSVTALRKILKALPKSKKEGYGYIYWNPDTQGVKVILSDEDDTTLENKYSNAFRSAGAKTVIVLKGSTPRFSKDEEEKVVLIKAAGDPSVFQRVADFSTSSPLATTIAGALLGGAGGYAGGTALEWLFPNKFRKDSNKRLALLGALGGMTPAAFQYMTAKNTLGKAHTEQVRRALEAGFWPTRSPGFMDRWVDPMVRKTRTLPVLDEFTSTYDFGDPESQYSRGIPPAIKDAAAAFGQTGAFLKDPDKPISVNTFNAAVWNDVGKGLNPLAKAYHTPPQLGAVASGIMSGVQQMNPHKGIGTKDVIRSLAGAGLGSVTARAAGGVLGTLAGLSQPAQNQLQNVGMWAGLLVPAVNAVLGTR